ncbi:MAG: recombination protein RecR, partial [Clostridia bacterium]
MENYIEPIAKLISAFTKLPSVGPKTAQRYALALLNMSDEQVSDFAR